MSSATPCQFCGTATLWGSTCPTCEELFERISNNRDAAQAILARIFGDEEQSLRRLMATRLEEERLRGRRIIVATQVEDEHAEGSCDADHR